MIVRQTIIVVPVPVGTSAKASQPAQPRVSSVRLVLICGTVSLGPDHPEEKLRRKELAVEAAKVATVAKSKEEKLARHAVPVTLKGFAEYFKKEAPAAFQLLSDPTVTSKASLASLFAALGPIAEAFTGQISAARPQELSAEAIRVRSLRRRFRPSLRPSPRTLQQHSCLPISLAWFRMPLARRIVVSTLQKMRLSSSRSSVPMPPASPPIHLCAPLSRLVLSLLVWSDSHLRTSCCLVIHTSSEVPSTSTPGTACCIRGRPQQPRLPDCVAASEGGAV